MIAYVPAVVLVVGLLAYVLSSNGKVAEMGRIAYACGLLVLVAQLAGKTLRLMAFLMIPVLLSSCACWTPEHRNDKACVVLSQVIDCTKDAVLGGLSHAAQAIIGQFINGSTTVDWDGLLTALEGAGIKDGGCVLANLEADLFSKASASPAHAARSSATSQALEKFKRDMKIEGVKFCVASSAGGKVCR